MVTRTFILVTPSEAAAFAATSTTSSSSSSAAAADSIINNAPAEQNSTELQTNNLCNYPSYTKPAQHTTSPGGLVQLCRHKGCLHAVDFERRGGGLCCIHQNQKGPTDGEQSDSEDDAKIRGVTADEYRLDDGLSDRHSTHGNNYGLDDEIGKKHDRPSEDSVSGKDDIKRQRVDAFVLDLTDVPPQSPIPKSAGHMKEGSSKYTGVTFDKRTNKWYAQIMIDGKVRFIGSSKNEEEAGVDYARALLKYRGQGALEKAREQNSFFDLSGVPPQLPIPKLSGRVKEGASKYKGISFNKQTNKWHAQIMIAGKSRFIGSYENEGEAAVDYARAVFKYKGQGRWDRSHDQLGGAAIGSNKTKKRQKDDAFAIDLTDVPTQSPIPKSSGRVKEGASKYKGISFNKQTNKWHAQIMIEGKNRHIGSYEIEEEAAVDYARAVFKFNGQGALGKARDQNSSFIDLSDAPPQSPIPKSAGHIKEGASKYKGISFNKPMNKWQAKIYIDGKNRLIGYYDNEEAAAVDYARAVFKYKNQDSFIIDLSDVPRQPPIPKSSGRVKEGASKYKGISFNKQTKKWHVQIMIAGKTRFIGSYDNEEEAAVDYARALRGAAIGGNETKKRQNDDVIAFDLTDVPPQSPIPKSGGYIKEGASKYKGVSFDKQRNKWHAQIMIAGKSLFIGSYENEEKAGADYARALFKYRGQAALGKAREQDSFIIGRQLQLITLVQHSNTKV
eukprot:scaffold10115_cov95-Skeletonema_dohrnii-CCMP3373.AAC.4